MSIPLCRAAGAMMVLPLIGCAAGNGGAADRKAAVREPAVQGQFYPGNKEELIRMVDGFLAQPPAVEVKGRIRAIISPHAGYIYSGPVAAEGFRQIPLDIRRVIVMGPSHHVAMRGGGSIPDVAAYRNVLGDVPLDPAAAVLRRKYAFFGNVPAAHKLEHSVEVMLPFLQRRLRHPFTFIPIVLGFDFDAQAMARALAPLAKDPKTLVVASSDLSHYYPYAVAEKKDHACLAAILSMNVEALRRQELCGKEPVAVLLDLARLLHWKPVLVDYKNSGDTAGDKSRVVGYGCVAFVAETPQANSAGARTDAAKVPAKPGNEPAEAPAAPAHRNAEQLLDPEEQKTLLRLARQTLRAALEHQPLPELPAGTSGLFAKKLGCFVTLQEHGRLRGCIGNIFPVHPLAEAVRRNAINAAFHDPRFRPLRREELDAVHIEISVLTVPRELEFKDAEDLKRKLRPGIDGVVLQQGMLRQSTYLPQVWEQLPDKESFLTHLCLKGGMAPDAWKDPNKITVLVYQAFVFGENQRAQ